MSQTEFENSDNDVTSFTYPENLVGKLKSIAMSDVGLMVLCLSACYFALLGNRPLANPDEGRYAEIPREMLKSGDFVTPRLNGVKYFEKPPLVYWLTSISITAFGLNEFAIRFWSAFFAIGGIVAVYGFAKRAYDRNAAVWASVVLGTSLLYMGLSQIILIDMIVSVLIAGALFLFLSASQEKRERRRTGLFVLSYALMGFAVLAKGLIGIVLPVSVIGIWLLLGNRWKDLSSYCMGLGLSVFLIISLPWHIAVAISNPDFLGFYFVHEHFERFTTQVHSRVEPWWFFVPVLLGGLFPWAVFLIQAVRRNFDKGWRFVASDPVTSFLLVWVVFVTLFFSVSQSKLIPYILPVFPAIAVLLGKYLSASIENSKSTGLKGGIWIYVACCWVFAISFLMIGLPEKYAAHISAVNAWRVVLAALLALGSLTAFAFISLGKRQLALISMAAGSLSLFVGLLFLYGVLESKSTKEIAVELETRLGSQESVYCLGDYFQDLPVYLGREVSVVDYKGELAFGINSEPEISDERFLSRSDFAQRWKAGSIVYAVLNRKDLDAWSDVLGNDPGVIMETKRYALVTNGK